MSATAINQLIETRVAEALANQEQLRNNGVNGDGSQNSRLGTERPTRTPCECTYMDCLNCHPLNFKGTEGNSHMKAVTQDVAYAMDWKALKKMMTVKYCPKGKIKKLEIGIWNLKESDEVEKYVSGLPDMIRGNVMSYRPQTIEKVIEFANDQMDQKLNTISERQAEQKRKIEFNAGNNQGYQQQNKRQNTGKAYAVGTVRELHESRPFDEGLLESYYC
ncbi:hypothetical protein Tco_1087602 [Tanacetum coccineum]